MDIRTKIGAGFLAAASAAALAVPVFAQTNSSAAASETGDKLIRFERHLPMTQDQLREMVERQESFLANFDQIAALHKGALTEHVAALKIAAEIGDETRREEAVRSAHETMRERMEAAIEANPDLKGGMLFLGGPGGHHGMRGHGPMKGMLAEKLGMTPDELRAVLESGKSIEEIAEERGVELPAHPMMFKMRLDSSEAAPSIQ
jgi:hypothetical protein